MISAKRCVILSGSVLLLLLFLSGVYLFLSRGISVTVTNGTARPLRNIRLGYRGGEFVIPQLEPAEHGSGYLHPSTETDLVLSYEAEGTGVKREKIDMYMEPGYRGDVDIVITEHKTITRANVLPSLIP